MAKVRVGSTYVFNASGMDIFDRRDYTPTDGTIVTVVNQYGCPKANTMGQCYIAIGGKFVGMVDTSSLTPVKKAGK